MNKHELLKAIGKGSRAQRLAAVEALTTPTPEKLVLSPFEALEATTPAKCSALVIVNDLSSKGQAQAAQIAEWRAQELDPVSQLQRMENEAGIRHN